jgi:hypothetical protein
MSQPLMVIRTSFKGLLIWFGASGALALLGLAAVETDEVCGKWGYTVLDATSCQQSSGYWVAAFFGGNCLLAALSILWALVKNGQRQREFARLYGSSAGTGIGLGPSGERIRGSSSLPRPVGPKTLQSQTSGVGHLVEAEQVKVGDGEDVHGGDLTMQSALSTDSHGAVVSSVTFERKETLAFKAMRNVTEREIRTVLAAAGESFRARQSVLVGILLAEKVKHGGQAATLSGLRATELFEQGISVGTQLFTSSLPTTNELEKVAADMSGENLEVAHEDADYFVEVAEDQIESLFESLPQAVRDWYRQETVGLESSASREAARRMFIAGLLYIGFQVPPPAPETTF